MGERWGPELTHLQLKACGDESVHRLALWVATQISSDVTESLAARERGKVKVKQTLKFNEIFLCVVPKDYGYLPSSSTLPSIIQTCQVLVCKYKRCPSPQSCDCTHPCS